MVRRGKRRGRRKPKVSIVGPGVGLAAMNDLGYFEAFANIQAGNLIGAGQALAAGSSIPNIMSAETRGLIFQGVKNTVGPIHLFNTRRRAVCLN